MLGFMETVQEAWEKPVNTQDALLSLHVKLLHSAKALKAWRRRSFNNWKLRTAILQIILLELEMAHERRTLSQEELEFKKFLKSRLMGAIIQKCQVFLRAQWGKPPTYFFTILIKNKYRNTCARGVQKGACKAQNKNIYKH
jgi:hypothetical protein